MFQLAARQNVGEQMAKDEMAPMDSTVSAFSALTRLGPTQQGPFVFFCFLTRECAGGHFSQFLHHLQRTVARPDRVVGLRGGARTAGGGVYACTGRTRGVRRHTLTVGTPKTAMTASPMNLSSVPLQS